MIEVKINVNDCPDTPKAYFDFIEKKLKDAGIPACGAYITRGKLFRLDDPQDFSMTIYRWEDEERA